MILKMTDRQKEQAKDGVNWFLKAATPVLLSAILCVFGYFGKSAIEKFEKMENDIMEIKSCVNTQSNVQNQINLNQMQMNVQLDRRLVKLEPK